MTFSKVTVPEQTNLLIAFIDIQGLKGIADVLKDPMKLFSFLDSWAKIVIKEIDATEGRVLKFIGDECLIAFPDQGVNTGILTLLSIKKKVEKYFKSLGYANKVRITAHYGEVAIGQFGTGSHKNLDVIGETVNTASGLGRGEHRGQLIISAQAFRKLSTSTKRQFHKYAPPIVYLAEEA
jgi:adenylate cyclase